MPNPVGVPSVRGIKDAAGDFGVGAIGGLAYSLSKSLLGNGFLGAVVAALIAGSAVKGARGTALATIAGFLSFSTLFSGGMPSSVSSAAQTVQDAVM